MLAVALGGAMAVLPTHAWAALDSTRSTVTGATFTTSRVPPSASFTCGGLGVLSVTFNWAAVSGATSYTLHYGRGRSDDCRPSTGRPRRRSVAAISGGTAWVVANRNFGSTTWSSVASNTRNYTVAVVGLCS